MFMSVRITNLIPPNLISSDHISSELSCCEAAQFAMAVTSRNAVCCAAHVKAESQSIDDPCDMAKTGHQPISLFGLAAAMVN